MRRFLAVFLVAAFTSIAASVATGGTPKGVVAGRVWQESKTVQCVRAPCLEPAPGVKVTFTRAGVSHVVKTNMQGRYSVTLAPGMYRATTPPRLHQLQQMIRVRSGNRVVLDLRPVSPETT